MDATVVAVAVAAGGAVILTGDPSDMAELALDVIGVTIESL